MKQFILLIAIVTSLVTTVAYAEVCEGCGKTGDACTKDIDCAGKCFCQNGKCGGSDSCNAAFKTSGAKTQSINILDFNPTPTSTHTPTPSK